MSSGIELILSQGRGVWVQFVMLDVVAAKKWAAIPEVELWQAVALHSSLDPDLMGGSWDALRRYLSNQEALDDLLDAYSPASAADDHAHRRRPEQRLRDILGEVIVLPAVNALLSKALALNADDRKAPSLPDQIKAAAQRKGIDLPDGWKADAALRLVSSWATQGVKLPDDVLASASKLFAALNAGFANAAPTAKVA